MADLSTGAGTLVGAVVLVHARRYPLWEEGDLYKLLHQATQGSEHAVADAEAARRRLEQEWVEMGEGPAEPLVDPIREDGALARVHLRPFRQAGLDPEALLGAFLETARAWKGSVADLEEALGWATEHAVELGLSPHELGALAERMKGEGYPRRHHSAAFVEHYRPAYRVVAVGLLPGDMPGRDRHGAG